MKKTLAFVSSAVCISMLMASCTQTDVKYWEESMESTKKTEEVEETEETEEITESTTEPTEPEPTEYRPQKKYDILYDYWGMANYCMEKRGLSFDQTLIWGTLFDVDEHIMPYFRDYASEELGVDCPDAEPQDFNYFIQDNLYDSEQADIVFRKLFLDHLENGRCTVTLNSKETDITGSPLMNETVMYLLYITDTPLGQAISYDDVTSIFEYDDIPYWYDHFIRDEVGDLEINSHDYDVLVCYVMNYNSCVKLIDNCGIETKGESSINFASLRDTFNSMMDYAGIVYRWGEVPTLSQLAYESAVFNGVSAGYESAADRCVVGGEEIIYDDFDNPFSCYKDGNERNADGLFNPIKDLL